jgi:DNA-binding transcriptional LysR family regulator
MNLRQLQHFIALAETGSVRQGSAQLNLSQPALSKSIRALEDDLGVILFERLARGLRLTPVGAWLLSRSASLLADVQRLRAEIDLIKRQADSLVQVAAGTVLCASLMPRSLARLRQVAPNLRAVVTSGYWDDQRTMLLKGEIDFLVADARELEDVAAFDLTHLPPEPIAAFARPDHPLAGRTGLSLSDLMEHDSAGLTRVPRELERVFDDIPELALRAPDVVSSNDFGLLRGLAARCDLLLYAPPEAVADLVGRGELAALDVALPPQLQTRFAIVWRRDRGLSPAAEMLKLTILECAQPTPEAP